MSLATARLQEERKSWRKDHPVGFVAKPKTRPDGSIDMSTWNCIIPGQDKTYCEGGKFPCTIIFGPHYPTKPPSVFMPKGFFHVNVFDNGGVCLSILKEVIPEHLGTAVTAWCPSISVKQILISVQELLHEPNFGSMANEEAYHINSKSKAAYAERMRQQALKYRDQDDV